MMVSSAFPLLSVSQLYECKSIARLDCYFFVNSRGTINPAFLANPHSGLVSPSYFFLLAEVTLLLATASLS
jgi:hypothetical protein